MSDADDIRQLTAQLGYEVEPSELKARLSRILSRPDQHFLVAEVDRRPVAWLHATISEYLDVEASVVIGGLVVDESHRRKGIGRMLMKHAEQWAKQVGVSFVRLWSSSGRTASHRFYEQLGYTNIKTQHAFIKSLDGDYDLRRFVPRVNS